MGIDLESIAVGHAWLPPQVDASLLMKRVDR